MQMVKCPNCGAAVATDSVGRNVGCEYCGYGRAKTLDAHTLATSLGRHANNIPALLETLATTLEGAFPGHTQVERKGLFTSHVAEVRVEIKHNVYRIALDKSHALATRTKVVRGVKLKDETLALHVWLEELSHSLAELAAENHDAHAALTRFLGG
jgi:hypothetical protein